MMFSINDLYQKLNRRKWSGQVHFYPSGRSLTHESITEQYAWLEQNVDVKFGDRAVVVATLSPETISTMLWLWHKGAVVVPVKPDARSSAINDISIDCDASTVIKDRNVTQLKPPSDSPSMFVETSQRNTCGTDLALLVYTSGSTGAPKGIMLTHNNVVTAIHSISSYLGIDQDEHILCLSPLSFDYGLYQVFFCLAFDCQLTLFEDTFHPVKVIKAIKKQQITLVPVLPMIATSLSKVMRTFGVPGTLKKITNTGGHLPRALIDDLLAMSPTLKIFAMYGLTECKRTLYLEPDQVREKEDSVGKPIPGIEAKIFREILHGSDRSFLEVDVEEVGELFVRGSAVMQGYYGRDKSDNIFPGNYRDDNWLATGDLFSQDDEGFFYFRGRKKELIKQGGFCLYPSEVEVLVAKSKYVNLAAVVPSTDKFGHEVASLCLQLHEDTEEHRGLILEWLRDNLDADYMPRNTFFIKKIQTTPNGKIDKKSVKQELEEKEEV